MRILLLGATGFIGQHAAESLLATGHDVTRASRSPSAGVIIDVDDPDALQQHLRVSQYDAVVNLLGAGLSPGTADAAAMTRVNSDLPARLLRSLAELDAPPHLVHAASSTERLPGQALDESEYSRTKHDGSVRLRRAAHENGAPVTILTIHNTYGPGQPDARFVAGVATRLREDRPVSLNFPHRVRDFVHVDDVASCIRHAVEHPPPGLVEAEAGTGTGMTLREAAVQIAHVLDRPTSLVTGTAHPPVDAHPVTVCPVLHGTYGLCTTDFPTGIRRTLEA